MGTPAMITVTSLRDVRCTLAPARIVSIEPGPPTTLVLDGGLVVWVRESAPEVERLIGLGARWQAVVEEDHVRLTVLRDPEGNEFCVLAPDPR